VRRSRPAKTAKTSWSAETKNPQRSLNAAAVPAALLVNCPPSAFAAYHSPAIIILARVTPSQARAFDQAPAVTDGWGLIAWCAVSLTEILLLAMGAIVFATAMTVVMGIASGLITVA
jgi:hypothetical protein